MLLPRQARDPGGLVQAEADYGPGMKLGDCLPSCRPFFLHFFSIFSAAVVSNEDLVIPKASLS